MHVLGLFTVMWLSFGIFHSLTCGSNGSISCSLSAELASFFLVNTSSPVPLCSSLIRMCPLLTRQELSSRIKYFLQSASLLCAKLLQSIMPPSCWQPYTVKPKILFQLEHNACVVSLLSLGFKPCSPCTRDLWMASVMCTSSIAENWGWESIAENPLLRIRALAIIAGCFPKLISHWSVEGWELRKVFSVQNGGVAV